MGIPAEIERYTVDDYRLWDGDWELIHGFPFAMAPSPAVEHQRLGGEVFGLVREALKECPHCLPLYEIDVEFAADTVVRPDVLVICYEPEGERLTRAPELIFEIIAKSTGRRDEVTKFALYQAEGVLHYVLVYPESHKAKVYRLVDGEYRKVGDFSTERHVFELSKCRIDFNFERLWRRK